MKRLLITGATGFVGRACLPWFDRQKWEIHTVSRNIDEHIPQVHSHCADMKEPREIRALLQNVKPTHLLHAAWCTNPKDFWHSPDNHEWLEASLELFETFVECGGSRIVGLGSCAEYDWNQGICTEHETPCRPTTPYGEAKLAAGRYLDQLGRQGISTAWTRLFFMYGPGASIDRMPGSVISAISRGEPALCSTGEQRRDFLYIQDVARAIVAILESGATGPINVCSGSAISIASMAEQAARLMDGESLLRLGALPTRPNDPALIEGNNVRLIQEVGWRPRFSLAEGLQATISAWSSHDASTQGVDLAKSGAS